MRTIHCCLSVRGALNWPLREQKKMLRSMKKGDGTKFRDVAEMRNALMDELAQGHELLPMSDDCEGFDYKTGCPELGPTDGWKIRQGQRRGASQPCLCGKSHASWSDYMEAHGREEYGLPAAPPSSVENAACFHTKKIGPVGCIVMRNEVGSWRWLFCERCHAIKQWDAETQTADDVEWKPPASSPVPKLVEALRQSLDIVHAALQLSGLGEIPANVTRARWLKVYENLNCLVSIEEDAKGEHEA